MYIYRKPFIITSSVIYMCDLVIYCVVELHMYFILSQLAEWNNGFINISKISIL